MTNLADYTKINASNLCESILDHTQKYMEAVAFHKDAYQKFCDLKLQKNLIEAQLDEKIRTFYNTTSVHDPMASSEKPKAKLTEAQITAKIHSDMQYINTVTKLNEAEANYIYAGGLLEAMKQRKEMIQLYQKEQSKMLPLGVWQ